MATKIYNFSVNFPLTGKLVETIPAQTATTAKYLSDFANIVCFSVLPLDHFGTMRSAKPKRSDTNAPSGPHLRRSISRVDRFFLVCL